MLSVTTGKAPRPDIHPAGGLIRFYVNTLDRIFYIGSFPYTPSRVQSRSYRRSVSVGRFS